MTAAEYSSLRASDVVGKRAKVNASVNNVTFAIAPGTVVTILRKFGGFDLETERCSCCHVQVRIRRVPYAKVELLP